MATADDPVTDQLEEACKDLKEAHKTQLRFEGNPGDDRGEEVTCHIDSRDRSASVIAFRSRSGVSESVTVKDGNGEVKSVLHKDDDRIEVRKEFEQLEVNRLSELGGRKARTEVM